jgi:DNA-directed RNA polymerase
MIYLYDNNREEFEAKYLSKAKEKAQFMSCFLALYKAIVSGNTRIKTPVLFDATCSGMQHLSALTTNISLGSMVNIIGGDEPQDFYQHCATKVVECIEKLENTDLRDKLLQVNIDRKLLKIPVMTIPYNIKLESLTEKITDKFEKFFIDEGKTKKLLFKVPKELSRNNEAFNLTGHEAGKLGSIVYLVVTSMMPPIQPLKDYFAKIIRIVAKINEPIF